MTKLKSAKVSPSHSSRRNHCVTASLDVQPSKKKFRIEKNDECKNQAMNDTKMPCTAVLHDDD
jgi:hypothetical protein